MPDKAFPIPNYGDTNVSVDTWLAKPTGVTVRPATNIRQGAIVRFSGRTSSLTLMDAPERLADMLRFALDEVTALLPAAEDAA